MSQNLHGLCCLLVEEFYGVFHASLYAQLTPSGRYTAGQIAQKVHLPVRQVRAGLATLVQLRLVYHHTSNDLSTYQANTTSAYNLMRCGKLVELGLARHGEIGREVITSLFLLGFCTISELAQRVAHQLEERNTPLTNGHSVSAPQDDFSLPAIYGTIQDMASEKFFVNVRAAQFQSDFDAFGDAALVLKDMGIVPPTKGRKGLVEYELQVETEKRRRQSENSKENGYVPTSQHGAGELDDRPAKRRKYSDQSEEPKVNGHGLPASTVVSISYRNVLSCIRNEHPALNTKKSLGSQNDRVLKAALSQIPLTNQQNTTDQYFNVDIRAIKAHLDEDDGLKYGEHPARTNGHTGFEDVNSGKSLTHRDIDENLATIAESMFDFVSEGYEKRQWRIDKKALDSLLQKHEMLRLIGDRLQPPALRIVRMLMEKGKLDEKTLQEAGLLGAKQLRQTLAELKQMGFVDLQEVPREAQRQPNRTMFLWFHDSPSVRQLLLENIFKAMIRLMQRLKFERRKLASTLEKVERSDVRGSETQVLSPPELIVLRRFQRTEEWLKGEMGRLDVSVAILRDL